MHQQTLLMKERELKCNLSARRLRNSISTMTPSLRRPLTLPATRCLLELTTMAALDQREEASVTVRRKCMYQYYSKLYMFKLSTLLGLASLHWASSTAPSSAPRRRPNHQLNSATVKGNYPNFLYNDPYSYFNLPS